MSLTTQTERSHQLTSTATVGHSQMTIESEKGLFDLGGRLGERLRLRSRVSHLDSVDIEQPVSVDRKANTGWKHDQLCWEAKGKCLQDYMDLGIGLRKELNQSRQQSFGEVSAKLFMIGKTPERAKPIIVISSIDKRSREAAKKAVIKSGILTNTNFEVGVLKYVPTGPIRPVASSSHHWSLSTALSPSHDRLQGKISDVKKDTTPSLPHQPNVAVCFSAYYDPKHQVRMTGMPIFVKTSANQSRRATANIIYNGSKYGYITAAHAFSAWDQESCSIDSGEEDIGVPFDSDSDEEDPCDEQISPARRSHSVSVESTKSQAPEDETTLLHGLTRRALPCDFDSPAGLTLLGHINSVGDLEKSIDCAIITVDNLELCQKLENLTISKRQQAIQIASAKLKSSPVIALTMHGAIEGKLNNVPTLTSFPGSHSFHSVYAFSYQGTIEAGDSGSLVIDSVSRELYGMVIAASNTQRIAYIVDASELLSHISEKGWRLLQVDENYITANGVHEELIPDDSQSIPTPHTTVVERPQPEWNETYQRYLHTLWDKEYDRYYRTHFVEGHGWVFFDWLPTGTAPAQGLSQPNLEDSKSDTAGHPADLAKPSSTEGPAIRGTYDFSMVNSNTSVAEPLDSSYYVRDSSFFTIGRVFSVLFSEGLGVTSDPKDSAIGYGEYVYSQIRRFIVVGRRHGFCYAVPIFTYGGQATRKRGVLPDDHAIAYSIGNEPQLVPGEQHMPKRPIPVVMKEGMPPLSAASRINFGVYHPVQHNVKVKDLGMVRPDSIENLVAYWYHCKSQVDY